MDTAQLKKVYKETIAPALQKQFNYSSAMEIPVLKKIVINQGLGMGKGKGDPAGWVAPVTPGRILFEVEGVSFDVAKEGLRLAAQKLPVKTKFIVRRDYDKNA